MTGLSALRKTISGFLTFFVLLAAGEILQNMFKGPPPTRLNAHHDNETESTLAKVMFECLVVACLVVGVIALWLLGYALMNI